MDLHSLLSVLMPYLAVLYIADCLTLVRGGNVALVSAADRGFRLVGPGLRILGLLPTSWVVICRDVPVPVTGEGVYAPRVWAGHGPRPWREEDYDLIARGAPVKVTAGGAGLRVGARSLPVANGPAAARLARTIETARNDGSPQAADGARPAMEEAMSVEGMRGDLDRARAVLRPVRFSSAVFFLILFVLLPPALYIRLLAPGVVPLTVTLLASYVSTVALFWRSHSALYPLDREERQEILATLILLPVGAAHAVSKATRGLFARYEWPLPSILLPPEKAEPILAKEILRAGFSAESGGRADLVAYWKERRALLCRAAAAAGLNVDAAGWTRGPKTHGPTCPLCESVYREGQIDCADCGIPLVKPAPRPR